MVLITFIMACLHPTKPDSSLPAVPVSTVITQASPESAEVVTTPSGVQDIINEALKSRGLKIAQTRPADAVHSHGTAAGRVAALLKVTEGQMGVLIDTTARPRAELSGRYPWQVDVTITVAQDGREPLTDHRRIPVSLTHIHQGETDALQAASSRIARRTAVLVDRFRRDAP